MMCLAVGAAVLISGLNTSAPPQPKATLTLTPTVVPTAARHQSNALDHVFDPRLPVVSQTLNGITLRVQTRNADLNRIILNCTVDGPPQTYPYSLGLNYINWAHLVANGQDLPSLDFGDIYLGGCSGQNMPGEFPSHYPTTLNYDTSLLNITSDTLALHLIAPIFVDNQPSLPPVPVPTNVPGVPTPTSAPPTQIPPPNTVLTYTLDFSVPIDKRCRVATINHTVEASGIKMELHYVSVTASETRFQVGYLGDDVSFRPVASASLYPGPSVKPIEIQSESNVSSEYRFSNLQQSLLDIKSTDWTITVDNLLDDSAPPMPPTNGPWTFHFTMPLASICASVPAPVGTTTP